MQDHMIQIRDQPRLAGGNNTDGISEAVIISFQLLFRSAENSIVPMAKKLNGKPKKQYSQKEPLSQKRHYPKGDTSYAE